MPRQRTLRASIEWSYELLDELGRRVFDLLAVFAGGWSLEAAQAVYRTGEAGTEEVLDALSQLIDKSLVLAEENGGVYRYRMLETLREFALERLQSSGAAAEARELHARFFLQFAQDADLHPELPPWDVNSAVMLTSVAMRRLGDELDNLRAALEYFAQREDCVEASLRMVTALAPFWSYRGLWSEGRRWSELTLARGMAAPPFIRAQALFASASLFKFDQPRLDLLQQSVSAWRSAGDGRGLALALGWLGRVAKVSVTRRRLSRPLRSASPSMNAWRPGMNWRPRSWIGRFAA